MTSIPENQEANLGESEEERSGEAGSSTSTSTSTSSFTCEICIEPTLSKKRFNNNKCLHPYCVDCLAQYITVKVKENVIRIPCPSPHCNQTLDALLCRPSIPPPLFNKWCDILCNAFVLELDRRYCPYPECSALVLNECRGNPKKSKCPNCKKFFCYKCQVPWHGGYWCSEWRQRRDPDDVNFDILIKKFKWTRCLKCGQAVERIDGCNIVRCRCGNRFCHNCGKQFHLDHSCNPIRNASSENCCCEYSSFITLWVLCVLLVVGFFEVLCIKGKSL